MHKSRILIAEDEGIAAMNLEGKIADLGYESAGIAISGEEALNKCREKRPDLVLMDIKLKGDMDGVQAARAIQSEFSVPVVFVSAFSDDTTVSRAARENPFGYLVKPLRDTTVKTTIEMALQKHQMEKALHEVQEKLRQNAEELKQTNAELENFANVAAHDLGAPLNTIHTYLQLVNRSVELGESQLDPRSQKYIMATLEATNRMRALLSDLLAYSKIGKTDTVAKEVDSEKVVRDALSNLAAAIYESGAKITVGSLPVIQGDPFQWMQVFQNLISNSIKYRSEASPEISVSATKCDDSILFCVKDNGVGFDPKYAETVFESFKRLQGSGKPGTGLGLAICRKIVALHGGKIWAESHLGKGTCIYFTVPDQAANR